MWPAALQVRLLLFQYSAPGSGTVTLVEAHFDSDANGFAYVDDAFRGTAQPGYANGAYMSSGGYTTGALQVGVGGINSQNILNMSGGWRHSFTIGSSVSLALVFRHRLTELPTYETDEFTQTLVTFDGVLRGVSPNDYIAQVVGGGRQQRAGSSCRSISARWRPAHMC